MAKSSLSEPAVERRRSPGRRESDQFDVTRREFEAVQATIRDMMSILQRYQSDLEQQFKRMAELQSDLFHLHGKIRY